MAQTTASAPQQGVNMPAVDLRQLFGSLVSTEGVRTVTDLVVAQRAAGANMSVDIAAGSAVVQDDHATGGGFYAYTLATAANVAVGAADGTNPRIDRVVVRVRDAAYGDAANDSAPVVVAGTPTAGATLVNLNGAAAVPGSSLLLANVLVPTSSTTVTTANIGNVVNVLKSLGNQKVTTSAFSGGPPVSPLDGDIWIGTAVDANGTRWEFQYNAGSGSASKWEFIGGPSLKLQGVSGSSTIVTYAALAGSLTLARAGDYEFHYGALLSNSPSSGQATLMALNTGGGAADGESVQSPSNAQAASVAKATVITVAASATAQLYLRTTVAASTNTAAQGFLFIRPVRIT